MSSSSFDSFSVTAMESSWVGTYIVVGVPAALFVYSWFSKHNLRAIPTVGGPSLPLLSYLGAFNYVNNARSMLQEGYDKYKGGMFKIPMPDRWLVVVTGTRLVDELQRLPDEYASFAIGAGELINTTYIFGPPLHDDPYHIEIIQKQLTRNITTIFDALYDEICVATEDFLPGASQDWMAVPTLSTIELLVARASNRVFVGLPLCRDPGYLHLAINFTRDVSKARKFVGMFPPFLKSFAAKLITDIEPFIQRGIGYLGQTIEERIALLQQFGPDYSDKPNDMLQWLTEAATARGKPPTEVMRMMLLMNFASIFTTSTSLTHALHQLAAEPGYVQMLRDEVETTVTSDGWSKQSLGKMRKLDSFLKESQRYNGTNTVTLTRMIMKDVKFSDGTRLPAGTLAVTAAASTHRDAEHYQNSDIFDPLRFLNLREDDSTGRGGVKYQFVTTSPEFLGFGHGKHACPGRFFASSELKAILAHLVLNYDMKLEKEGVPPPKLYHAFAIVPDPSARVIFRKRRI